MNTRIAVGKTTGNSAPPSVFNLFPVTMLMIALSGCASMISESKNPVYIDSVPTKMEIVVTDRDGDIVYRGKTPTVVDLDAGSGYFVREQYTVSLYDGKNIIGQRKIESSIDVWYFANWFGATLIGFLIVDPITGAMWTLEEHVTVYQDVGSTHTQPSYQIQLVEIEDIPESQRDSLIALRSEHEPKQSSD